MMLLVTCSLEKETTKINTYILNKMLLKAEYQTLAAAMPFVVTSFGSKNRVYTCTKSNARQSIQFSELGHCQMLAWYLMFRTCRGIYEKSILAWPIIGKTNILLIFWQW